MKVEVDVCIENIPTRTIIEHVQDITLRLEKKAMVLGDAGCTQFQYDSYMAYKKSANKLIEDIIEELERRESG
jgi:hypothetical protein